MQRLPGTTETGHVEQSHARTFHVGLNLPDELVGLGAVEQGPDGGKGVQDNGLRVGVDVFLKGKHTPFGEGGEAGAERWVTRKTSSRTPPPMAPPALSSEWGLHHAAPQVTGLRSDPSGHSAAWGHWLRRGPEARAVQSEAPRAPAENSGKGARSSLRRGSVETGPREALSVGSRGALTQPKLRTEPKLRNRAKDRATGSDQLV